MMRITSARPYILLIILFLSACSQTARQPISDADIPTDVDQAPSTFAAPEFWSKISGLTDFHSYRNGHEWRLTRNGIEPRNYALNETADRQRVERIWREYGTLIVQSANEFGVPIELILTTISVESAGNPNAKGGNNYGLMQTTLATAKASLDNDQLVVNDLYKPSIAIKAGTKYLRMQYEGGGWFGDSTNFDLPKAVAAYNAGRLSAAPSTPWGMKIYTPNHIDKSVVYFNESLSFLSRKNEIPQMSFAAYFAKE